MTKREIIILEVESKNGLGKVTARLSGDGGAIIRVTPECDSFILHSCNVQPSPQEETTDDTKS